ncbi:MAG: MFS transporter, partial [Pseudomonadota bacterium]
SVHYIRIQFGDGHQGQGQALYSGLTYGAGGAFGAWISGVLVEWESTVAAFYGGAGFMLVGIAAAWLWMRPAPHRAYASQ